ncbi:hypothetical protein AA11826_0840 [Komagataeibacter oboediens DSM 11826]|uniref:Phage tail protein n=1 Tax=Komagataeibacter oboediens TaxID=65958 RepID=A0A318QRU4_9PROT|nr:hypothetical protein [Komagataeibacter oboediens]PYD80052.1 hypothetical protein CFR80_14310 [Komagataeibacter oboediens]GBR31782.1 hypothetical protein AA11826_0840 [Komagataeibacter oboediens DSM 11826]
MTDTSQQQGAKAKDKITPPNGFSWKESERIVNGKAILGMQVAYEVEGKEHSAFFVDRLPLSKSIAATEMFGAPKTDRGALALSAAIRLDEFDGTPVETVESRRDIDRAMDRLDEEGLEAFICALIERSKTAAGNQADQDVDTAGN